MKSIFGTMRAAIDFVFSFIEGSRTSIAVRSRVIKHRRTLAFGLMCLAVSNSVFAAYVNRFSVTTNGAVTFTGNTLGLNKLAGQNNPGTSGSIGAFITTNLLSQVGSYPAGTTLTWQQNSSAAILTIPAGSTVLYAELIWGGSYSYGGQNVGGSLGTAVSFTTPSGTSAISPATATNQTLGAAGSNGTCATAPCFYVRSANVTSLVQAAGAGTYTVGGVPATVGASEDNSNNAGWTLAVVYGNSTLAARNMTVFVGAETSGNPAATVTGLCTPPTGPTSGRLLVSALEGDSGIAGDQMEFGPSAATVAPVSGPNNVIGNFFASQINGDTGALDTSGTFGSSNQLNNTFSVGRQGYDITNVDVSATLANGQTTAAAQGTTTGDQYAINALGLQINVGAPSFPVITKSVNKPTTYVGDTLTYTIILSNATGTADAVNVIFTDTPPPGTTFVPNSLTVGGVPQAGANPSAGVNVGTIAVGASKTITFQTLVTAIPTSPAVAQYSNSASWTYQYVPCAGQATVNATLNTNAVVTTIPRLLPTKTASPAGSVSAGQTLTYTIAAPNTGTANSAGTTLADSIPTGTTYVANSTTLNGAAITDVAGAMPYATAARPINSPTGAAGVINVGETATVIFKVTVNAGATGPITNTATIDPDGPGPAPAITAQASSNIAALSPSKSVSPTGVVAPAQILTYTIAVPNTGNGNTTGTTLADPIPAGMTYVPGSTTLNGTAVPDVAGAMPFASAAQINSPTRPAGQINAGETATVVFKVTVNSAPGAGPLVNTATIDPDGPGPAAPTTAQASSPIILTDVVLAKSHVGNFSVGAVGNYTLQVSTAPATGPVNAGPITVTDTLPTGLTVAAAPSGTNWNCSATVVGSTSASCTYAGTYPIAPGTALAPITLTVNVAAAAAPSVINSATVAPVAGEASTANNTATDLTTVIGKPTIAKAFSPASVPVNGTTTLTLTLTNSNPSALTGVSFTDSFPAGLVVAATPALSNSCAGSITGATASSNSLTLTAGTIPASGTCVLSVAVSAPAGSYTNTSGGVAAKESGAAGTASNSAVLTVVNAPSITKAFSPTAIGVNGTSILTFTLTNPSAATLTGVAFSDTYPSGLINASPSNVSNTCGGAIAGGTLGGSSIALSGASFAPNSSCTVVVTVTASTAGNYVNNSSAISSTNGGTGNTANATLTVLVKSAVAKAFNPTTIASGGTSTLTLTLANSNAVPLTGVTFNDTFPSGLTVAAMPGLTNSCSGSVTGGAAGNASIGLSAGSIPANGSCAVTVAVTATTTGGYTNTSGAVTSAEAGTGAVSNSAVLNLLTPPSIAKAFSPTIIATNATSTLTFTLTNNNAAALTGAVFTDTYPAGLLNATTPAVTNSCGGSTTGGAAAGTNIGLTGGTIPANGTCTVSVIVTSAVNGSYANVSGAVSATNGGTGNMASATLIVAANPTIAKRFSPTTIATGGTSALTLTLSNTSLTPLTGLAFNDSFPSGLTVAATPSLSNSCNGTITGGAASNSAINLSGGTLAANSTCSITVSVTAAAQGSFANTTGSISSTQTGTAAPSNTAVLKVLTPPSIAKSFSPSTILVSGTSTLTLVLTNPDSVPLTGLAFTDTFPTGLLVSSSPTASNSCGGTLNGATPGATSFNLSGGSLSTGPGTTCTITLQVTTGTPGTLTNSTNGVSSNETLTGTGSNASILVAVAPDLRLTKTHAGSFTAGSTGAYTLTPDNQLGTGATSGTITVTDTLPTGLSYVATGSGGTGWNCSVSGQIVTCTSTTSIAAGATGSSIAINVGVGSTAVPSVTNNATIGGGNEPAAYSGNNSAADYTVVNAPAQNAFLTDGQQTGLPGTAVFYTHTFNVGVAGTVAFSTSDVASPALAGWSNLIYRDSNCNGVLDGTEGNAALTGSTSVAPGDQVCIVVKSFMPASATYNAQDQITVYALFTPSAGGGSTTTTHTDLTTVGTVAGAGFTMQKSVRNATTGGAAVTNNMVSNGNVLEYTITYGNNGSGPLNVVVINDATTAYATFISAACGTPLPNNISACTVLTQPSVGAPGTVTWTLSGSLAPGASGSVSFQVQVH